MMADEPTLGELMRLQEAQAKRTDAALARIDARLDVMPDKDTILAYLATRDTQMNALSEDVKSVERRLEQEAAARKDDFSSAERRANNARNFAIGAIGLSVTILLGVVGLINQIGGTA